MEVVGLTSSQQNSGSYALILQETGGQRRLSILIGQDLAQAIAIELEDMRPPRPLTHDLLKTIIQALGASLAEVTITELREGTFYAALKLDGTPAEIDARPSDAIALAIRFGAPIYVLDSVLENAGAHLEEGEMFEEEEEEEEYYDEGDEPLSAREKLEAELEEAVEKEDYEKAARLRDEIDRLDESESSHS